MSGEALTTTQWQKRCDALARRVDHMADLLRLLNYENEKPVGWPSRKAVEHALASSGGTGAAYECPRCFKQVTSENHVCYLADPGKRAGAGLREIVERAVREGWNANESGTLESIDEIAGIIVDRVLAGERATRDEGAAGKAGSGPMGASEVRPTDPLPVALPSREQAGRADSSASDEERARAWLREHYHDVRMGAATPSLANLIAAIRHEAMAQAIAASIRALAGDAPAERRRTDAQ